VICVVEVFAVVAPHPLGQIDWVDSQKRRRSRLRCLAWLSFVLCFVVAKALLIHTCGSVGWDLLDGGGVNK